jgi:uncharacterized membrane protein YfcA
MTTLTFNELWGVANLVLMVLGFGVGLSIGLSGMGGGAVMTPALVLLGINPSAAVGTDLAYASLTKFVGALQHLRQKTVNTKAALFLALGSVPASVMGTAVVGILVESYGAGGNLLIREILAIVLIFVGFLLIYRTLANKRAKSRGPSVHASLTTFVGAAVGFLVGLTSVGSGTLISIYLLAFTGLPTKKVVGTDILHASILVAAAAAAHWTLGNVQLGIVVQLLFGSIPGVLVGSRISKAVPTKPLRIVLSMLILLSGVGLVA